MDEQRAYPHSLEAERSLLGAVLVENDLLGLAGSIVSPEHFYRDAHRRLWAAYGRLSVAGQAIDITTLRDALVSSGELDEVGGMTQIVGLTEGVPRSVNVESYARIVRRTAALRELIKSARVTIDEAFEADDADEVFDRAEARLLGILRDTSRADFTSASDWMRTALANIERNSQERRHVTGVPTGIKRLDEMTRGLQPSHFIIIGARTAVGKTSLALQMALEASKHVMAAFLSLEMSQEELSYRAVSLESQVDAHRLQTGEISPYESRLILDAAARIGERRLAIKDPSRQNLQGLCADIRRLAASRSGLGIVFVDYMQLIDGPKAENRTQEVSAISKRLKGLAMELRIPVVALAQLSRDAAKSNDRPQLHHLKESGSLEQDANVVLLLHRPQANEASYTDGEEAELIVAKNRGGKRGLINLAWRASLTRFADPTDVAPEAQPELL